MEDTALLTTLGVSATLIPLVGGIVKNTIDRLRVAFEWDAKQIVIMCYALSMIFVFLLQLAAITALPTVSPEGVLAVVTWMCVTIITGILAGNYAGSLTDGQKMVQQEKDNRRDLLSKRPSRNI